MHNGSNAQSTTKEIDSCLNKLQPGEPKFVLRAQDQSAWLLVHIWANINMAHLGEDHPKIRAARQIAADMKVWHHHKPAD